MNGKRVGSAFWNGNRWKIKVQRNGEIKTFYSSKPGRTGQREANEKADIWLEGKITDDHRKAREVWTLYFASLKERCGLSYCTQQDSFAKYYILPIIGDIRMDKLTEGDLQDVIDTSFKKGGSKDPTKAPEFGLSRKTLQGIRGTEVAFMKWCRKHGIVTMVPEISIPANARKKKKKILQPHALEILFSVDTRIEYGKRKLDDYIHAYRFAVTVGLRPGELIGLRKKDIGKGQINISRAINKLGEETQGKNENAIRTIKLSEFSIRELAAQIMDLEKGRHPLEPEDLIFPVPSEVSLYRRWKKYQKDNGIDPPISLYELRHTFVSFEKRLPTDILKGVVGHSPSMDTLGTYGHEVAGEQDEEARLLADAFRRYIKEDTE